MRAVLIFAFIISISYSALSQQANTTVSSSMESKGTMYKLDLHINISSEFASLHNNILTKESLKNNKFLQAKVVHNKKKSIEYLKLPTPKFIALYNSSENSYNYYRSSNNINFDINSALIRNKPYSTYTNIDSFNPNGAVGFTDAIILGVFNTLLSL